MNGGSLHTKSFRRIHFSAVFRYRWTKNGFTSLKSSRGFRETGRPKTALLKEVIDELHSIRSNCSTGPDNIPSTMIKMVADYLGPPLADVINTCNKNIGLEARGQLRDS